MLLLPTESYLHIKEIDFLFQIYIVMNDKPYIHGGTLDVSNTNVSQRSTNNEHNESSIHISNESISNERNGFIRKDRV